MAEGEKGEGDEWVQSAQAESDAAATGSSASAATVLSAAERTVVRSTRADATAAAMGGASAAPVLGASGDVGWGARVGAGVLGDAVAVMMPGMAHGMVQNTWVGADAMGSA